MDTIALAELLYPNITLTPDNYEARYPERNLPEGARVTRIAPSPTGFVHIGNFFPVITDLYLARQSGGVFYLRIEDTDLKREVPGGIQEIIDSFKIYEIEFDERATESGDIGCYGPYRQRRRAEIYQSFAKRLVQEGKAYPCFCSEEELSDMRAAQEAEKANFGYFGKWAKCRDLPLEEIERRITRGLPFVLRLKSAGNPENKITCRDLIKGDLVMPENDIDHVLLKSDGIPTYHFAHAVDDHLMRTTHVVRGDEWLATLPLHLQLFQMLGWKPPQYVHIAPLMKMDGESKRKLSKRKDPEAALSYYDEQGFPPASVMEYALTLLNSNFEEWRAANPAANIRQFPFSTEHMSASGSLFDLNKLTDVSKNVIAAMTSGQVLEKVLSWSARHDTQLNSLLSRDTEYAQRIFAIGRGGDKPRKDLAVWRDVRPYLDFFYDELWVPEYDFPENVGKADALSILRGYAAVYDEQDEQSVWFEKIRALSESLGYAGQTKEYKKNPGAYKGHVGDVSMVLRVAVTGRRNSPDMHQVMSILGRQRLLDRMAKAVTYLEKE